MLPDLLGCKGLVDVDRLANGVVVLNLPPTSLGLFCNDRHQLLNGRDMDRRTMLRWSQGGGFLTAERHVCCAWPRWLVHRNTCWMIKQCGLV